MKASTLIVLFMIGIGFLLPKFVHGADANSSNHFINVEEIEIQKIIPAPPGNYSPETHAELLQILQLQQQKAPEQVATLLKQDPLTPIVFLAPLFPNWTVQQAFRLSDLLSSVQSDAEQIANLSKQIWDRPRPSHLDKKIKPLVDLPLGSSYPGTNSTVAYTWATILSTAFPNRKEELMAQADQIAQNRVLAGVQYPSDIAAGKILGEAIGEKLLRSRYFR